MQCLKPRLSETFAFETVILTFYDKQCPISVLRTTREFCLVIAAKFRQVKGISNLCFKKLISPKFKLVWKQLYF